MRAEEPTAQFGIAGILDFEETFVHCAHRYA
jgi:hypothetical protein